MLIKAATSGSCSSPDADPVVAEHSGDAPTVPPSLLTEFFRSMLLHRGMRLPTTVTSDNVRADQSHHSVFTDGCNRITSTLVLETKPATSSCSWRVGETPSSL